MYVKKTPPVIIPDATKRTLTGASRIGYTALNCLDMIQGKVVANEDKYFSSFSTHVQETCRKSDTVLQMAKDWLKQVKQQWH